MTTTHKHWTLTFEMLAVISRFFWLISLWGVAWGQGQETLTTDSPGIKTVSQANVVIHQGQLTVNLQEEQLSGVLARIGQQAGKFRVVGLGADTRVSAHFASVPLEHGLRQLLQRAGLSHAILYFQTSTGAMSIAEVRIFGATSHPAPALLPADTYDEDEQREAEEPDADGRKGVLTTASTDEEEREAVATHLHGLLSWMAQQNSESLPTVTPIELTETEGADSTKGTPPPSGIKNHQ